MADDVTKSVSVVYTSKGQEQALKAAQKLQEELDQLAKSGQISDKALRQASRGAQQVEKTFGGASTQAQALQKSTQQMAGNLPRLRYALYDVSTTASFAGLAMAGLATATAGTAIRMNRQFADVVRTTGAYLDQTGAATSNLRGEFDQLFSTLPASWADVTQIGTLAGQLGIANENVAEFTSLVTKFASVTDVSVEASATAFGRLSELLNVSASEYENLGSSIAAVGVASVATESQIVAISSQIASMGAFVGLSADEVIGLSSALASLGTQPELSRGVVTRLFTNITKAISEGGAELEAFGRLAGTTGNEFADAWGDNAAGALLQLLEGLDRVDKRGGDAVSTLNSLGVTSVRDVPTILKLAQNYELVADQLGIASEGYAQGTALQEQYGVIAETVASKLTILRNNFQSLVATFGGSASALGPVIDFMSQLIRGLDMIVSHPIGQAVAVITVGLTALGGILAIVAGAAARGTASILAITTAFTDMTGSAAAGSVSVKKLTGDLIAMGGAARATGLAIKGALISTGVGAALVVLGTAIGAVVAQMDKANESAERLSTALQADYKAGEGLKVATEFTVDLDRVTQGVSITQEAWNRVLEGSSTYSEEYAKAVEAATEAVEGFQAVVGEETRNEILDAFQNSDDIRKAFEDGLIPENLDFSELTDALVTEGASGAEAYLTELFNPEPMKARAEQYRKEIRDALDPSLANQVIGAEPGLNRTFEGIPEDIRGTATELKALEARLAVYDALTDQVTDTQGDFVVAIEDAAYAQRILAGETDGAEAGIQRSGDAAGYAAGEFEGLEGATEDVVSAMFNSINATSGLAGSLYEIGQSVRENGNSFDAFSASGRENLQALQGVFTATAEWAAQNGVTFEDAMAQVGGAMVQAGIISVEQLHALGVQGVSFGNDLLSVAEATSQAVAALQNQMAALRSAESGLTRGQAADGLRYAGQAMQLIQQGGPGAEKAIASMGLQFDRLETSGLNINDLLGSIASGWDAAGDSARGSGNKQSKAAKDTQDEVRTLLDYVSDLSSVFSDAFDFRFGFQQASDDVAEANDKIGEYFSNLRADVEDAQQSIRDYRAELRSINADISSLEAERSRLTYFLSVAVDYKDDLRAEQIRAQLAENAADQEEKENDLKDTQRDLSNATKNLNKAQEDLIPNLDGTTEASREQRSLVLDLLQDYQGLIEQYAATGATQNEVARYTQTVKDRFAEQLRQLGYNKTEIKDYSSAIQDYTYLVNQVPRRITTNVTASTSPAEAALSEFTAKRRTTTVKAGANTSGAKSDLDDFIRGYNNTPVTIKARVDDRDIDSAAQKQYYLAKAWEANRILQSYGGSNPSKLIANVQYWKDKVASVKDYYVGGFTGRGGKYEPAGTVHKGEYVVRKEFVNQSTGLPYADAFARLSRGTPSPGYANGGFVQSSSNFPAMVGLTPMAVQQIAQAVQPYLVIDNQVVGRSASRASQHSTRVGAY